MYRILTHTSVVDVTEDHSLLTKDGIKIKPSDCNIGSLLLHSFPNFYDKEYNIDDIKQMNYYQLHKLASKLNIYNHNKLNKIDLSNYIINLISLDNIKTRI